MKLKIIALLMVSGMMGIMFAQAQVTTSQDCATASITEFGNVVVTGSQAFYQSLLQQSNADLMSKAQTDAAIQAAETEDQVQIATAEAGLNAISNCLTGNAT